MKLNENEKEYYDKILKKRIAGLPTGVSLKAAALFDTDPVSARICRQLFSDVSAGVITKLRPNGQRSKDGYTVR